MHYGHNYLVSNMKLCSDCQNKNCTMTNTGNCAFFEPENYLPNWVMDMRNRHQRRLDDKISKKTKHNKKRR